MNETTASLQPRFLEVLGVYNNYIMYDFLNPLASMKCKLAIECLHHVFRAANRPVVAASEREECLCNLNEGQRFCTEISLDRRLLEWSLLKESNRLLEPNNFYVQRLSESMPSPTPMTALQFATGIIPSQHFNPPAEELHWSRQALEQTPAHIVERIE